ncbi:MAG: SH3 domain-containing protein [Massilia sp.]
MTSVIAFAIGLLATLVLASFLTPARWWRRPNARALAVLVAGTWGIGSLFLPLMQTPALASTETAVTPAPLPSPVMAGRDYLVFEALNLRAGSGVSAPRITVVPVGATVTATGRHEGDWWQVHTRINGREIDGWASSLWLRRADEHHP